MLDTKLLLPIAGATGASFLIGVVSASAALTTSLGAAAGILGTLLLTAGGFGWWWHERLREARADEDIAREQSRLAGLPRYVLPEDVTALLDQRAQGVNAMCSALATTLDVERVLRERLDELAAYQTHLEDENAQLRAEADKVAEIQRVASSTPRLTAPPKTSPADYAPKRPVLSVDVTAELAQMLEAPTGLGPTVAEAWPAVGAPARGA